MSKSDLQRWLIESKGFKRQFLAVLQEAVADEFPSLVRSFPKADHDWHYLIKCASLLAQSNDGDCQEVALRIAQFCLTRKDMPSRYKDAAAVILDTMANIPAIQLAESRKLVEVNVEQRLPFSLLQDWIKRSIENTIQLSGLESISVNHFQKEFWEQAREKDWISVSAPTSAGKSFVLKQWIAEFIKHNPGINIIYLVPTRALISQVQEDLMILLKEQALHYASVSTIPLRSHLKPLVSNLLVLTQERLHILIADGEEPLNVGLLVVDEAQKIGDDYRGILLQQAIDSVVKTSDAKVIFASPLSENPDLLLEDAPALKTRAVLNRDDRTVNQNLIWASQVDGQPQIWDLELIVNDDILHLGKVGLHERPSPASKRLPFLAAALAADNGGNVIYVNGAADAEKAAKQLYDLVGPTADISNDSDIANLIDLTRRIVHRKYSLSEVLKRGIAFHYGNMPLILRTEIENLFKKNKIRFLVCTSTLVEGVNLPCRSILLRGPKKGQRKPMSSVDFWNLAGRAGRWGQEFQGNVICVDPRLTQVWPTSPPQKREKFPIRKSLDVTLARLDELVQFVEDGTPRSTASNDPNLEYTSSYLFNYMLGNGVLEDSAFGKRITGDNLARLQDAIQKKIDRLIVPSDVVRRNPGISPIAMDNMLQYLEQRLKNPQKRIESLIPVLPESSDAVSNYAGILGRINEHLGGGFGQGRRIGQLAMLAVDWMNGQPLARIIANRERRYGSENLPDLIRQTMKDVEEYARFKIPRFLSCYVDLVRIHLQERDRQDLIDQLFEVNALLEFGAAQATQLSLMGLGLSRSSAVAISELISSSDLDEAGVVSWLRENNWITEDLPELIRRDVMSMLERYTESVAP